MLTMPVHAGRRPAEPVSVATVTEPPHELVFYGAHGGAGTSTLRALLPPAWDLGAVRTEHFRDGKCALRTHGRPLVVVARGTVPGARRATDAVRAIVAGGGLIAVLVVVADGAGPEPREASARFRLLESQFAFGMVRMPFVAGLRLVDDPLTVDLPRGSRRALSSIRGRIDGPGTREST